MAERGLNDLFFEALADAIADRLEHRQEARRLLDMERRLSISRRAKTRLTVWSQTAN
jgi:hypothetical protein